MLSMLLKRFAAPVAAVALFAIAPAAKADSIVKFSTQGAFTAGSSGGTASLGLNADGSLSGDASLSVENTTLTYNAANLHELDAKDFTTSEGNHRLASHAFGSFSIGSTDPNGALTKEKYRALNGAAFTLTLQQLLPVAPADDDTGMFQSEKIKGTLWYVEDADPTVTTGSYLRITFDRPLFITIPRMGGTPDTIGYGLNQVVKMDAPLGVASTHQFNINGTVVAAAAPLPATAWLGLTLLGGFGSTRGLKAWRRRNQVAAA